MKVADPLANARISKDTVLKLGIQAHRLQRFKWSPKRASNSKIKFPLGNSDLLAGRTFKTPSKRPQENLLTPRLAIEIASGDSG